MSTKEPTQEEKDEQMIRDIEQRIEEVMELLSFQKDIDKEVETKKKQSQKSKNSKELTWAPHAKHKNIPITEHSKGNMELISMIKTKKKFLDHPEDLLGHLDKLTDKLLSVVERWCKPSSNTYKSSKK